MYYVVRSRVPVFFPARLPRNGTKLSAQLIIMPVVKFGRDIEWSSRSEAWWGMEFGHRLGVITPNIHDVIGD
jgi:hypothetical protein